MAKERPLIYLLHGWAVDQHNDRKWQPLIKALSKKGIDSKFLAIPGLSSPLDEVWGLQDFVDWLSDQLPSKNVVLLGHSFGGQMAVRFAAQNKGRLSKLILVDSAGVRDQSIKAKIRRFIFWWAAKIGKFLFNFVWAKKILYKLARERDYLNAPPLLKRSMSLVLDDEVIEDLSEIDCSTLIIWGKNDLATPIKGAYLKNNLIKNSKLKIIDGARHSPQFTHVEKVVGLINNFLRL